MNMPIRTLRLIRPGISFDYPHELRRKARSIKYGLFGAEKGENSLIRSRFRIIYGKANGRYGICLDCSTGKTSSHASDLLPGFQNAGGAPFSGAVSCLSQTRTRDLARGIPINYHSGERRG
jgi:hypothetical protein